MGDVLEFKIKQKERYACPECKEKGKYCPQWIFGIKPVSIEFEKLAIQKKIEWLNHTSHLRQVD